ncbi:MAG: hypothetical protein OER88_12705, partial [Planctomycetota bacterium]|nr:hypothetical protein [Planctomycetota bacterium]
MPPGDLVKPDDTGPGAEANVARAPAIPEAYPEWAKALAARYFSATTSVFLLHGNVHDFVGCEPGADPEYVGLADFLATRLFGSWDVVLHYDLGRGLRPLAGSDAKRLQKMLPFTGIMGAPKRWPREPDKAFRNVGAYLDRTMLGGGTVDPEKKIKLPKSVAVILQHAQYVVPDADINSLTYGPGARLVRLLDWAQNPYIKRRNIAFCLIADKLSEVNSRLVQNPYVASVEVPLPDSA